MLDIVLEIDDHSVNLYLCKPKFTKVTADGFEFVIHFLKLFQLMPK